MGLNDQWMQRDLKVLWHPCTQMKDHEQLPLIPIKRGEGVWLEDFEGKRYLDAVSSWWVNVFGPANPRINQRIKDQVDQLEHVILAGFSHQPVIELSERLVAMTPAGLDRVFYADNGSSCIEVALKMSFHYWQNVGKPGKKRFVTLTNSYHVGRRCAVVHRNLQSVAAGHPQGAQPRLLPAPRGHGLGRALAQHVPGHGTDPG